MLQPIANDTDNVKLKTAYECMARGRLVFEVILERGNTPISVMVAKRERGDSFPRALGADVDTSTSARINQGKAQGYAVDGFVFRGVIFRGSFPAFSPAIIRRSPAPFAPVVMRYTQCRRAVESRLKAKSEKGGVRSPPPATVTASGHLFQRRSERLDSPSPSVHSPGCTTRRSPGRAFSTAAAEILIQREQRIRLDLMRNARPSSAESGRSCERKHHAPASADGSTDASRPPKESGSGIFCIHIHPEFFC